MNEKNIAEQDKPRDVQMYGSDFKSTLPQQPTTIKDKRYGTSYGKSFGKVTEDALKRTTSMFYQTKIDAGKFHQGKD